MREQENIWGLVGCELPDGGLCVACCVLYEVVVLSKAVGKKCENATEKGCRIHETDELPHECDFFHCSKDASNNMRWGLINTTLREGQVSEEEADVAKKRWIIS